MQSDAQAVFQAAVSGFESLLRRQFFHGGYSLAGQKRLPVKQESESSNLSSHPLSIFAGDCDREVRYLLVKQADDGSSPSSPVLFPNSFRSVA